MTATLYRKYRPQIFAEVIGQEYIKKTLQNEIANNQIAQAYLFCGIRGVGKTTVARLLAKALNCEKRKTGEYEPCGKCDSCRAVTEGRFLDLLEMDAASNRRIDDIREVRERIPYGPVSAKFKVIIIDEAHMLTTEAFNALLKTLEEPPPHTIFILATTEVHKLPETIISRCQRFDFQRVPTSDLVKRLHFILQQEKITVELGVLEEVARLTGGSIRDAESYLGKLVSLGIKEITSKEAGLVLPHSDINIALEILSAMIERQAALAIQKLNDFFAEGGDLAYLHQQITELLRKILLLKLGGDLNRYSAFDLTEEQQTKLMVLADQITNRRVQEILEEWIKVPDHWRQTDILQLPLELAIASQAVAEDEIQPPVQAVKKQPLFVAKTIPQNHQDKKDNVTSGVITLEQVNNKWGELLDKLKIYNHSLSFILSVSQPINIEGNCVVVAFDYQLHKERVSNHKIREIIEQALTEVLGTTLRFRATVKNNTNGAADELLSNVLSTFGGKLE